jgi:hypothetical protein
MLSEFHQGRRNSRYFMAPLWIALALCGMGVAFLLGGYVVTEEWVKQDKDTLTAYKAVSPSSALALAAEGVKHDRIEFAVYRDLLRSALAEPDGGAHEMAFRSIRDVLQYGGAFAEDLRVELQNMAPQVFLTTSTNPAGRSAGDLLEKELRGVGMAIVNRESVDPTRINESKVSCYSIDTCKDAKALVPILRSKGYALGEADTSSRAEDNSVDKATTLYNAKVIRVVLLDPKQTQPTASASIGPGKKQPSGKTAHRTGKNPPTQTASR